MFTFTKYLEKSSLKLKIFRLLLEMICIGGK